jgi:hypothetical protein
MSYINANGFFENPEKAWQELIEEQKARMKEKKIDNSKSALPPMGGDLLLKNQEKQG